MTIEPINQSNENRCSNPDATSTGRLSFSHKRCANLVAVPLASYKSVRIVKRGETRACCLNEFPHFLCSGSAVALHHVWGAFLAMQGPVHMPCGWSKISRFCFRRDGKGGNSP